MTTFIIDALARPADGIDLSSATTAKRTGTASWVEAGVLEIPFDRALTAAEVDAVTRLLTAPTNAAAQQRQQIATYLALPTPTTAQNTDAIKTLAKMVLDLVDRT